MQFLKYKSARDAITRPLGNTFWISHQYLLLLYDTGARFIRSLPILPRMCTLNIRCKEALDNETCLLGLSLRYDSVGLSSFPHKFLKYFNEVCLNRGDQRKKIVPVHSGKTFQRVTWTTNSRMQITSGNLYREVTKETPRLHWTRVCLWDLRDGSRVVVGL